MDIISTEKAPQALGPYSQAIRANGFIFCSGQIPIDPVAGAVVATTAADQTRQAITNLRNVLEAAESGLDKVVKTTCFLADIRDFAAFNSVYAQYFPGNAPARSCVQVAAIPKGALCEVEVTALK